MKGLKKIFKILLMCFTLFSLSVLIFSAGFYYVSTKGIALDNDKLESISSKSQLQIYDKNGKLILPSEKNYIQISKLSKNTKNAFISAEDKRYYKHKGIDIIRIGGAVLSNLKTRSFSEGASTISQQLIKNTQLSSEKTIKRKLREIKLTKKLEKEYSKNEILEMYLNNIYFGNGCYGVENASRHYFNKSASNLTLAESALLAGTINAPSVYDIENKTNNAKTRRDLILKLMLKQNKISNTEYNDAINEKINLNLTNLSSNNYIHDKIIEESCKLLGTNENNIINKRIKIYTNIDINLNNKITNIINNNYKNLQKTANIGVIIIQNDNNKIISCYGNNQTLSSKKQPGSTIKPILVYAPAIDKGIISPATKLLDEKINISGYSPENADKKYHGYISSREALKNSYNIPAVKLLNEVGIKNAQNFANQMGINFSNQDNNLAIALGGFTEGVTLKNLCDAYTTFANGGKFSKSNFVTKIENENGKILITNKPKKKEVMSESTAYLITDMLKDCAKSGTAKRLKDIPFDVASKTGTVGKQNSKLNSDAYNISYTSEHTIITYIGGSELNESVNGSTYPTMLAKDILLSIYSSHTPQNFKMPTSVKKVNLNKNEYENNIISETTALEDCITEIFQKNNLPQKSNSSPTNQIFIQNSKSNKPKISFFVSPNFKYKLKRKNKTKEEIISSLANLENSQIITFEDKNAISGQIYEYFIEIYDKNDNFLQKSNSVKVKIF